MTEKEQKVLEALDSLIPTQKFKKSKHGNSYARIVRIAFERISKSLEKGLTFEELFVFLSSENLLPEDGDSEKLRQAYRREQKRVSKEVKDTSKKIDDTEKNITALPQKGVLKSQKNQNTVGTATIKPDEQVSSTLKQIENNKEENQSLIGEKPQEELSTLEKMMNETPEERMARLKKQLGSVTETGMGRIVKYADGSFDFD